MDTVDWRSAFLSLWQILEVATLSAIEGSDYCALPDNSTWQLACRAGTIQLPKCKSVPSSKVLFAQLSPNCGIIGHISKPSIDAGYPVAP